MITKIAVDTINTLRGLAPMLAACAACLLALVLTSLTALPSAILPGLLGVVCGTLIGLLFVFTGR